MSAPKRIQLRRTKGWRKPEGAIVVARPTRWGNPWRIGKQTILTGKRAGQKSTAADVVGIYRNYAFGNQPAAEEFRAKVRAELAGRDLACWCPLDQPCHADVLLEIANGGTR